MEQTIIVEMITQILFEDILFVSKVEKKEEILKKKENS